jgi:uncharacterized protein YjdB
LVVVAGTSRFVGLVGLALVVAIADVALGPPASAAPALQIVVDGSVAIHRPVLLGTPRTFEVDAGGVAISSVSWSSDDDGVAAVSGDVDGGTVTGLAEGVVRITATAQTSKGPLADSMTISVGTGFEPVAGSVLNRATPVLADARAGAEEATTWAAGRRVTVSAVSGGFFLVEAPDAGYPELDGGGVARWVARSAVDVPSTSVTITPPVLDLAVDAVSEPLGRAVGGAYANDVSWSWSSTDPDVASVGSAGRVTAAAEGVATIRGTASSSHGAAISDASVVSVYTPLAAADRAHGYATAPTSVRISASGGAAVETGLTTGDEVTVIGTADAFYRVTTTDGTVGYVPRAEVRIPATSITLSRSALTVLPRHTEAFTATVQPRIATDVVSWATSNSVRVTVAGADRTAAVTTRKIGAAVVTASVSGLRASATVTVTGGGPEELDSGPPRTRRPGRAWKSRLRTVATGATKVNLSWVRWDDATGYQAQRWVGDRWKKGEGLTSSMYSRTITGLQPGTTYRFRVRTLGADPQLSRVRVVATMTRAQARRNDSMVRDQLVARLGASLLPAWVDPRSAFVPMANGRKSHPYVKFQRVKSQLRIYLFLDFDKGGGWKSGDRGYASSIDLFLQGLRSYYDGKAFKGSANDFRPGMVFTTALFIEDLDVFDRHRDVDQEWLTVQIGGKPGDPCHSEHWYKTCASSPLFGALNAKGEDPNVGRIYMPWDHDADAVHEAFRQEFDYSAGAAHEMGHVLGLSDGTGTRPTATAWTRTTRRPAPATGSGQRGNGRAS